MSERYDASEPRVIVVVPSYNAETTLKRVCDDIPRDSVHDVIVVDDCSQDSTAQIAREMDVLFIRHETNKGYGGAQKTAYAASLEHGASVVVMIHGDYQYDPRLVPIAAQIIEQGLCDVVLGNRIRTRQEALAGGMPLVKYVANRALTLIENVLSGQNLGEWHSGFRAFSRRALEMIPFDRNSDDFVFDSQMLVQCVHLGLKIGDIPMPVRYGHDASSISFWRAAKYSLQTMGVFSRWLLHRSGVVKSPLFHSRLHT
jgi:glycosyltransferase involved in cell wall biosynthesis